MFGYDFWGLFPEGSRISWNLVYSQIATVFIGQIVWGEVEFIKTELSSFLPELYNSTSMLAKLMMPSSETSIFRNDRDTPPPLSLLIIEYFLFIMLFVPYLAVKCVVCILVLTMEVIVFFVFTIFGKIIVLVVLLLWLALYRIPIWNVSIPYIRARILRNNTKVYQPLPAVNPRADATIRVLRIRSGSGDLELDCDLVTTDLCEAHFEALSYVWGTSVIPYKIRVNGKLFYVTYNLYSALLQLRRVRSERTLWVDAICINQFDDVEKSDQVQLMRDIYCKASNVIVWLGPATNATPTAFAFLENFNASTRYPRWQSRPFEIEPIFKPHWKSIKKEVLHILSHEWFRRAWIVQEVIVAQQVTIQRGHYELEWERLYDLITSVDLRDLFHSTASTFIKEVQDLRAKHASGQTVAPNILDLVCRFRRQSATFGPDKIYSLLGLLKDGNTWGIQPDYSKTPETIFAEFTISCLQHDSLLAVSVASNAALRDISWCRDWRNKYGDIELLNSFSSLTPPRRGWSADGHCPPMFKADISRGMLSLRGFEVDTVAELSPARPIPAYKDNVWSMTLPVWEQTAGVSPNTVWDEQKEAFNRTITADRFERPDDWRHNLRGKHANAAEITNDSYLSAIQDSCMRRRFFITKSGRFGLGTEYMRKHDVVVVVLGSRVPFILRRHKVKQRSGDRAESHGSPVREYFKFVSEAYCDGSMYYEGDIQEDIRVGKLKLPEFHLL